MTDLLEVLTDIATVIVFVLVALAAVTGIVLLAWGWAVMRGAG